jgi:hypothetical protein
MHWGVFAISAAHLYLPKLPWRPPNPRETSKRMNFNVVDKKQLIWKLFIHLYIDIWCLFFIKKMSQNVWATIMPFGPVTLIFYCPKIFFFAPGCPHFRHWLGNFLFFPLMLSVGCSCHVKQIQIIYSFPINCKFLWTRFPMHNFHKSRQSRWSGRNFHLVSTEV